jgi:muramoyltetrapeptide carboxypeptidase LdcA involved in peptidoglycan recycling
MSNAPPIFNNWTIKHQSHLVCKGGYGTVRMIGLLDFTCLQKNPKWIVGFSDVTVLHHLNTMGYKSIHGDANNRSRQLSSDRNTANCVVW